MKKLLLTAAIIGLIIPATFTSVIAGGALVKFNAPVNTTLGVIGSNNNNIQSDIYFNGTHVPMARFPSYTPGYNFEQNGSAFHLGHVVSQTNVLNGVPIIDTPAVKDLDDVAGAHAISSLAIGASSQNTDAIMILGDIDIVAIDDLNVEVNKVAMIEKAIVRGGFWGVHKR